MSANAHKMIVSHLFEQALNQRNVDVVDDLFAPTFVDHSAWPGQASGPAGTKQGVADLLALFPDLRVSVDSVIADGDEVATRETWQGTHAPTGTHATGTVLHFFRFADGKITHEWSAGWDWLDQLNATTTPEQDE